MPQDFDTLPSALWMNPLGRVWATLATMSSSGSERLVLISNWPKGLTVLHHAEFHDAEKRTASAGPNMTEPHLQPPLNGATLSTRRHN